MNNKKFAGSSYGFTLIELLVVVSIISTLASVILVALNGARQKGVQGMAMEFDSANFHAFGADAVSVYNFDDGTLPPTDFNGNQNGGLTCTAGVTSVPGIINKAISLGGVDNCFNLSYVPKNFDSNKGSISFWVYPISFISYDWLPVKVALASITVQPRTVAVVKGLTIKITSTGIVSLTDTGTFSQSSNTAIPLNQWTNVLISWSSSSNSTSIYLNGKNDSTVAAIPVFTTNQLYIGNPVNSFDGFVDQFAVYTQSI